MTNHPDVLKGVTITGTSMTISGGKLPVNYFRGFVVRNADIDRGQRNPRPAVAYPYALVYSSSAGTANNGTTATGVDLELIGCDPSSSGPIYDFGYTPVPSGPSTSHIELRKVQHYWSLSGRGPTTIPIATNSNPVTYCESTSSCSAPTARYVPEQYVGGCWSWSNLRRVGAGANSYQNDFQPTRPDVATGIRFMVSATGVFGNTGTFNSDPRPRVAPGSNPPSAIEPLFQRGYKWDPDVAIGPPDTLVGANWNLTLSDPQTGQVVFSNDPALHGSGPNNNGWPEFVSQLRKGSSTIDSSGNITGNLPYPHPLISAPANQVPVITGGASAGTTFTVGSSNNSYTFQATGNPTPSFSPIPTNWPGAVHLTDNGDGSATLSGDPGTTVGSPWSDTVTAHNIAGDATQSFILTVQSPSGIQLVAPASGSNYTAPATIPLQATVTGTQGTVTFYNGATLIGTAPETTSPYNFVYTGVGAGIAELHAMIGATDSSHIFVNINLAAQPTPPGLLQVSP
jgi:hypothetical protein